ncbi:M15 family peptidase (plasmid) [Deinococcus psychrotolerans]|uniref:M15 family peptidase n=1 Tax=Deinococcus psychrotolerans TaxID=2489213 RepID=A0A3G8YJZ6_9DEIO|nr:M15 family metallopeptidase [Deinococcus psychrotolerans]AZI45273.1 M15 family peptidase [Deinococcus psychrotolerans]
MTFNFAAAIAQRPSDTELPFALGRFSYRDNPEQRGAVIPDPAWASTHLVEVDLTQFAGFPPTGGKPAKHLWMHKQVAPVFIATMQEAVRRGLLSKLREYNGCYVPRHMGWTPGRPLSVHSWGAAIDFDANTNGYGVPLARMQIDQGLVRCMEECGWTWGGRWTGPYADGMHFQWSDPLPGTAVQPWQDAMARTAVPLKPVPVQPLRRQVKLSGKVVTGRFVVQSKTFATTIAVQADGSVWMRPATLAEQQGTVAPGSPVTGNSGRVTLQDQAGDWTPFAGRAVYRGLLLNLDAQTADLSITPA